MISDLSRTSSHESGKKNHILLTGATGLLGRYLLRNLLSRYVPVAVLTRRHRLADAQARIDNLVAKLEDSVGRRLPRPFVVPGDLGQPDLALTDDMARWIRTHVGSILHNAASLSFQDAARNEDPWLTNVGGTGAMLELAERGGIRQFHHVSTAYVCGQRTGRVLESERNVGQSFGNDYERSKIEAEEMVSSHGFDSLTIYRPAIIVGDSRTGFTSTFHGFYTPLHIVHTMINKIQYQDINLTSMTDILGLEGSERKNLVPVDWVAAVMTHLVLDPRHHGLTYHLTAQEATPVSMLSDVFAEAIARHSIDWERMLKGTTTQSSHSFDMFLQTFQSQMTTYRAYWRDDPTFDTANTKAHAPHLSCPTLDRMALLNLCRFAIESNFWSAPALNAPGHFDVQSFLEVRVRSSSRAEDLEREPETILNLCVSGPGGGEWRLCFDGQQRLCSVLPGLDENGIASAITSIDCLRRVDSGEVSIDSLVKGGGISLESVVVPSPELHSLLNEAFSRSPGKSIA